MVVDLTDRQYTTSLVEESTGKSLKQIQEYVLVIDHLMTKVPDYNIYVYIYIIICIYTIIYIYISIKESILLRHTGWAPQSKSG